MDVDVYVGDFSASALRLRAPRRLTLDEHNDWPEAWTADSRAVVLTSDRNGTNNIFLQQVNQTAAQPIVTGREEEVFPRLSPDGLWLVYVAAPQWNFGPKNLSRLMRVSISGGAPELVFTTQGFYWHGCARLPSKACAVAEQTDDQKELVLTSYNPLGGRGNELVRIRVDPGAVAIADYNLDISPRWFSRCVRKAG